MKDLPKAALLPLLLATAAGAGQHDPAPIQADVTAATPVDRYRLLRELGQGAMGVVYLAEQQHPVRRAVALKVAHATPQPDALRAQLAAEAQTLATLQHEHIVHVFDAGTTSDGRAWLAMEYVDGEPLAEYCDRRGLDIDARARLLAAVCGAVQHMHDRGVLHCDLKPDNILVTEVDGQATPKIIDLGLACWRGSGGDDGGDVVAGTPAYMAAEHFTLPRARLDARADVFALGVLLHEQVTGVSPFANAPRAPEATRVLARPAVARASHRWRHCDPQTLQDAARRGTSPRQIARQLGISGLDDVIAAALAPRREDRTASAAALASALAGALAKATAHTDRVRRVAWSLLAAAAGALGAGAVFGLL